MFGVTEAELIGKNDYHFFTAERAEFSEKKIMKRLLPIKTCVNEEWALSGDGHSILLETSKTPMRDAQGNLLGVVGVGRDITAKHK